MPNKQWPEIGSFHMFPCSGGGIGKSYISQEYQQMVGRMPRIPTIEERIGKKVKKQLFLAKCYGMAKDRLSKQIADTIFPEFKLTVKATPFSKHMTNKKLTPRQKLINKSFIRGREYERSLEQSAAAGWRQQYDTATERNIELNKECVRLREQVKICSALLQSIHTTAQSGATILGIK